jgi:hypothetical protein
MYVNYVRSCQVYEDLTGAESILTEPKFLPGYVFLIAGANPTIVSYNAGVVNIYNATSSLVC